MPTNPAEKKRNVRGSVDPKVSAWDRMNEFKDQCLTTDTVSGNLKLCIDIYVKRNLLTKSLFEL